MWAGRAAEGGDPTMVPTDPSLPPAVARGALPGPLPRPRRAKVVTGAIAAIATLSLVDIVVVGGRFGAAADVRPVTVSAPRVAVLSARRAPELIVDLRARSRLQAAVADLLSAPSLGAEGAADSCLLVRQGGRSIATHNPGLGVLPASTMKVLTATAVLATTDRNARFTTTVRTARPAVAGVVADLWLVGGGDPILATDAYLSTFKRQPQIATSFERLVDGVVAAGISRVTGPVVADERFYDDQRGVDTWKASYQARGEVGQLSAMAVNDGFNQTDGTGPWRISAQPAQSAAELLVEMLRQRGVVVDGGARVAAGSDPDAAIAAPVLIAAVESPPVVEVLSEMLGESDNTTAELMVKHLGKTSGSAGSTATGLLALRAALTKAGLDLDQATFYDGSGLDRNDRVTCALLASAVELAPPELIAGLPVGGESGTLSQRMRADSVRGRVKAKTGSLNGVAALTGVVDANGTTLEFALVLNSLGPATSGVTVGDELAALLVAYPDGPTARDLAP